jgi:hypothetical protein
MIFCRLPDFGAMDAEQDFRLKETRLYHPRTVHFRWGEGEFHIWFSPWCPHGIGDTEQYVPCEFPHGMPIQETI